MNAREGVRPHLTGRGEKPILGRENWIWRDAYEKF